ncbi:TPA: hypothetical protein VIU19_001763 [Streptococcus pyogenes]|nr:hypothetical protein [Streptococcus pyogenes]HEP3663830.1 hypothetical protein [Streptococcus pyogenes]HEP6690919.1 hypothetical protein [Streptococcus pyogenes]HEP6702884.1 hypothetical protein [Streptococcus pyogenes]HEQ9213688.1 hypothetical protein [Streptococcus pyogenes]
MVLTMKTYCIINKKTGFFVYGTDYRYSPPHQRTSDCKALTFGTEKKAKIAFEDRKCGKNYKIIPVKFEPIEDKF